MINSNNYRVVITFCILFFVSENVFTNDTIQVIINSKVKNIISTIPKKCANDSSVLYIEFISNTRKCVQVNNLSLIGINGEALWHNADPFIINRKHNYVLKTNYLKTARDSVIILKYDYSTKNTEVFNSTMQIMAFSCIIDNNVKTDTITINSNEVCLTDFSVFYKNFGLINSAYVKNVRNNDMVQTYFFTEKMFLFIPKIVNGVYAIIYDNGFYFEEKFLIIK